jgi:pimeloyl-ACP methyl ester carboxylesterase
MSEFEAQRSHGMHVVQIGPREAPPLLLIHGSGFSGASWSPLVPALASRHRVVRIDLPGCGQSPPAPSYDVPVQAGRVAALLDELGLGPVTAVGHSSGGYVATALTEQRPELVRSLVLMSTGPSPDALLPQPILLRALLAPPGPLLWARRSDAMIRKAISATCARPVDVPDDLTADVRRVTYRAMRTLLRRNTDRRARRDRPDVGLVVRLALHRQRPLQAPVLIMQAVYALGLVPIPPPDHVQAGTPDPFRDRGVRQPFGRQQHDPGPLRQPCESPRTGRGIQRSVAASDGRHGCPSPRHLTQLRTVRSGRFDGAPRTAYGPGRTAVVRMRLRRIEHPMLQRMPGPRPVADGIAVATATRRERVDVVVRAT